MAGPGTWRESLAHHSSWPRKCGWTQKRPAGLLGSSGLWRVFSWENHGKAKHPHQSYRKDAIWYNLMQLLINCSILININISHMKSENRLYLISIPLNFIIVLDNDNILFIALAHISHMKKPRKMGCASFRKIMACSTWAAMVLIWLETWSKHMATLW